MFPQFSGIFGLGSIPGSSTENKVRRDESRSLGSAFDVRARSIDACLSPAYQYGERYTGSRRLCIDTVRSHARPAICDIFRILFRCSAAGTRSVSPLPISHLYGDLETRPLDHYRPSQHPQDIGRVREPPQTPLIRPGLHSPHRRRPEFPQCVHPALAADEGTRSRSART
jgi:hypothetical protein